MLDATKVIDNVLTGNDVRWLIEEKVEELGSQRAFATEAGISASYINDYLLGRRSPGPAILRCVGVRKIDMYEKMSEYTDVLDSDDV